MFISLRVTRRGVVKVIVFVILAQLFYMAMNGLDQFSSDWNRTFGGNMPNSNALREKVRTVSSGMPDVGEEFVARAEANASNSESLLDVMRGVADLFRPNADLATSAPAYGAPEELESPYDRFAD